LCKNRTSPKKKRPEIKKEKKDFISTQNCSDSIGKKKNIFREKKD